MRKIFISYDAAISELDRMMEDAYTQGEDTSYWMGLMSASIALTSLLKGDKQTATFVDVEEKGDAR